MRYISVSESIRQNGDRHKANAERYLAEGKPDYAAGSLRKAARNYYKADELDQMLQVPAFIKPAYDALLKAVEDEIFGRGTHPNQQYGNKE